MSKATRHVRIRALLICVAALVLGGCESPATPPAAPAPPQPLALPAAFDSVVRADLARQGPAVGVAVLLGDTVVLESGYGFADLERRTVATPAMVFQIGSITKQFTAAAVMRLAEQGRLRLDDDVTRHLPDLRTPGYAVTLHHLLTHTSGVPDYTRFFTDDAAPVTARQVMDTIESRPFRFAPDDGWEYSNSGYYLLGLVIERVSGRPYGAYLQEEFFGPLSMGSTSVCGTAPNTEVPFGYVVAVSGGTPEPVRPTHPSLAYAAGAICSTVGDLARWQLALTGGRVVSPESYARMTSPVQLRSGQTVRYGYGLAMGTYLGARVVGHGGAIPGFQSQLAYYPERRLSVVVLTNQWPSAPDALERRIARRALAP